MNLTCRTFSLGRNIKFFRQVCRFVMGISLTILFLSACQPTTKNQTDVPRIDISKPEKNNDSAMFSTHTQTYGQLADGTSIDMVTLHHPNGMEVDVISYGGIITRLTTPDRQGVFADVVLGLDNLEDYVNLNPYFGALIGRYGNRIANGKFTLNNVSYQLDANAWQNHLHGGKQGFDKKVWSMAPFTTEKSAGIVLTLQSPDGDQGYPGQLDVEVIYELTADMQLDMRFKANTNKTTIVNMTQHTYFNLAAAGDVLEHTMQINSQAITPVDQSMIPTGDIMPVKDTAFDFTQAKTIGKDIDANHPQLKFSKGYDHNYVIKTSASDELVLAAIVTEPTSGRVLEVWSEEPAIQFYTGNGLNGSLQGKGRTYGSRSGFCLEPQHTPDSPNLPLFPSTTLEPEQTYQTRIIYQFYAL